MNKKIIGLLLILCLVVGLLPVVALADAPKTARISILKWTTVTVTEGGEAQYYKNKEVDLYDQYGNPEDVKGYSQTAGNANDWNVKVEYPAGGVVTITLKDAKIRYAINGTPAYTKKADGTYSKAGDHSAFGACDCKIDVKFVLEGENFIDCVYGIIRGNPGGIEAFNNITIESKDGGKLTGNGGKVGITPEKNGNLTFNNAIIDIANTKANDAPIYTTGGNITINGGHITVTNTRNAALQIYANNEDPENPKGGDLTINDAKLTATAELTDVSEGTGSVDIFGSITINGNSELNLEGLSNPGMFAHNGDITVNGGKINVTAPETNGVSVTDGDIKINGGTIGVTANKAFNKALVLGDKVSGVVGASAESVEDNYSDGNYSKPWILLSDNPASLPTPAPTETPTVAPTQAPTKAPTQTSTQTSTQAPTQAPTQSPTKAPAATNANNQPSDSADSNTVLYIIAAAIIVVAAAAVVLIVVKRKKA